MMDAVRLHDRLLSSVFETCGGRVFKTLGDAFCVAFENPVDAVKASLAAQTILRDADWPVCRHIHDTDRLALKVRIAILSGVAEQVGNDYFGRPLNRVARPTGVAMKQYWRARKSWKRPKANRA